ncbi:iron-sulfur cluster assembly scaffold protein [Candidatus Atribacteria bacterium MT.SAG.1]|nr:iron-sulfur cluster assembly scaffold protein [Candidatus Atribacteria bacterium MT.SAG.1]
MYSEKVIKHFKNPKNMGRINNPDGVGKVGNLICGDVIWLYIKVRKDKKTGKRKIIDVKFETFGCVVAIAVSSMITTLVKGKTLAEALKITKDDVLKKTGKLPGIKVHCSVLADDALHEAIYDYFSKNKLPIPKNLQEKHKKVQKQLKIIEKRYKEYIELEKKVFKK